jgi:antitoxin CptB
MLTKTIAIDDLPQIAWACRRGMLELDIALTPFFKYEYLSLSEFDKSIFIRLLSADDPDLFSWLMGHGEPANDDFKKMIILIRQRNQARGPLAE